MSYIWEIAHTYYTERNVTHRNILITFCKMLFIINNAQEILNSKQASVLKKIKFLIAFTHIIWIVN